MFRDIYYSAEEQMFWEGKVKALRRWVLVLMLGAALCPRVGEAQTRQARAGARQEPPAFARLRFPGPQAPTVYLRYQDGKLKIARSEKELGTARPQRPVRAKLYEDEEAGLEWQGTYPGVRVPGPIGRFTAAYVRPVILRAVDARPQPGRPDPPACEEDLVLHVSFIYRDRSKATWEFVTVDGGPLTRTSAVAKAELTEMTVPDPAALRLDTRTFEGEGGLTVTVQARAGTRTLQALRREGRAFPVRLEIANAAGKVVHATSGDLWKFCPTNYFGYNVELAAGTYTVTATVGRTPFHEAIAVTQEVTVD
jgi:hypothetical protein